MMYKNKEKEKFNKDGLILLNHFSPHAIYKRYAIYDYS